MTASEPTPDPHEAAAAAEVEATEATARGELPPKPEPAEVVPTGDVSGEQRTWGTLAHASAAAALVVPAGHVLGPLAVWLARKERSPFEARHTVAALNFQLTMSLALALAVATVPIVIGFLLLPAVVIADVVYTLKATMNASERGEPAYPDWTLELVR